MRYQLLLDKIFNFDIDNYCEENHLEKQDFIRHLVREEIYRRQSLARKANKGLSQPFPAPRKAGMKG